MWVGLGGCLYIDLYKLIVMCMCVILSGSQLDCFRSLVIFYHLTYSLLLHSVKGLNKI